MIWCQHRFFGRYITATASFPQSPPDCHCGNVQAKLFLEPNSSQERVIRTCFDYFSILGWVRFPGCTRTPVGDQSFFAANFETVDPVSRLLSLKINQALMLIDNFQYATIHIVKNFNN